MNQRSHERIEVSLSYPGLNKAGAIVIEAHDFSSRAGPLNLNIFMSPCLQRTQLATIQEVKGDAELSEHSGSNLWPDLEARRREALDSNELVSS